MPVGAIIVAGGRGARLGAHLPKQLLDLGGRSMLQRSVEAFDRHGAIDELVIVLPEEFVRDALTLTGATVRPSRAVAGGARRQDSVRAGAAALSRDVDLVLVHDAARPFVDAGVIDRVVVAAREAGAAIPAVQVRDTVKRVA
ncbi:MAG TPA: 2-C-methyl-D-erythritol 4-phosphate cytidylyltransferase, partial [Vicinamibacterales bacterium]|nr:2-C-methyl-D-erythritol 4-phosphate cytidylyltransferase [Vicinamibacterales bacterium]